jgi:hypothetical protein
MNPRNDLDTRGTTGRSTSEARCPTGSSGENIMNTPQHVSTAIHDLVNEVTTTVEDLHRSIAELPLTFLESVKPLEEPIKEIRDVQARSITAIYGLIRRINDRVEEINPLHETAGKSGQ